MSRTSNNDVIALFHRPACIHLYLFFNVRHKKLNKKAVSIQSQKKLVTVRIIYE